MTVLKLAGLCLIVLAAACVGLAIRMSLAARCRRLEALHTLILQTGERIRFERTDVETLLRAQAKQHEIDLPFLTRLADLARAGLRTEEVRRCLRETSGFKEADIQVAADFFCSLGRTDAAGQAAGCALYAGLLAERCEDAREALRSKGRLYGALSVFAGLFLAIVLL